jgi:hypothetical protein
VKYPFKVKQANVYQAALQEHPLSVMCNNRVTIYCNQQQLYPNYNRFASHKKLNSIKKLYLYFNHPKELREWPTAFTSAEQFRVFLKQLHLFLPSRIYLEFKSLAINLNPRFLQQVIGSFHMLLKPVTAYTEWAFVRDKWSEGKLIPLVKLVMIDVVSFLPLGIALMLIISSRLRPVWLKLAAEEFEANNIRNNELWLFINGVSVTKELHYYNALQLAHCVKKTVYCLHNSTNGLPLDLLECFTQRTFNKNASRTKKLKNALLELGKLYPNRKLILCVHSQGAILASHIIQAFLLEEEVEILKRMEVYTFGCAALRFFQYMDLLLPKPNNVFPFYEHFANWEDCVAKIGVLRNKELPYMPGNVFVTHVEGHMFGEHYLPAILRRQYVSIDGDSKKIPRFYSYLRPDTELYSVS